VIVTSFNPAGYEKYGRKFIETYYASGNTIPLMIYYEEEIPDNQEQYGYDIKHLFACPGVLDILDRIGANELCRGIMPDGKLDWRFNAYKFCRKTLAIGDYFKEHSNGQKFVWLDADIIFTSKLPDSFVDLVVPDSVVVSHLARERIHSECGFIGFNPKKDGFARFMANYWAMYITGAFIYAKEWHDSFIFDQALTLSAVDAYSLCDLSDSLYPFDNTILADWMIHNKGPKRKDQAYGVGELKIAATN
jgi:hypothetical protein